ncbi:MAG: quinol dehydrogenase ferredoxin subunit NapH [Gammaproteobacteria bacterium]|nr:quinol dehydrogenase ferredoxin subunit NapH [Gammaproteobacteria bacterium]
MRSSIRPGVDAIASKGWLLANKWLLARRFCQLSILTLFMLGPWFGIWIITGNLNSSLVLGTLPLTDPYVLIQSIVAGHTPATTAITGAIIVLLFYAVVSGRVFCSWVCPVNMITDFAHWLRERLGISGASMLPKDTRYWLLGASLLLTFSTGNVIWEIINPVSMLHRGLIFGMGLAWLILLAVFLFDLLISRRGWCGHLCPVGAFYSLLGSHSLIRIRADARARCNDCMDCFVVCPEQQVIRPALKGEPNNIGPVITSANCTNCGRCIDVCSKDVFHFGLRANNKTNQKIHVSNTNKHNNHSSGVEVL